MTATANKETIERLYAAFADLNGTAMTACHARGAHFRDPAFGDLEGDDIGAMWRMLTGRARDLEITLREHDADESTGTAHWLPASIFSPRPRGAQPTPARRVHGNRPLARDLHFLHRPPGRERHPGPLQVRPGRPDHRSRRRLRLPPLGEPGPRPERPPGRPIAAVAEQSAGPGAGPA